MKQQVLQQSASKRREDFFGTGQSAHVRVSGPCSDSLVQDFIGPAEFC